jgi:hypothetical protein
MLLIAAASAILSTVPDQIWGGFCIPGFCPAPLRSGPPSGLMFVAIGLVGVGVRGLLRRRGAP